MSGEPENLEQTLETIFSTDLKDNLFLKRRLLKAKRTGDWSDVSLWLEENKDRVDRSMGRYRMDEEIKKIYPFHPVPSQDDFNGSLNFGTINRFGHQFRIDPNDLTMHCMTLGATGAGKSWLILNALIQLCRMQGFNVVIPDVKTFYRRLLHFVPNLGIITARKFRFNPLEVPPWLEPKSFIFMWSKVFAAENGLGAPSEGILLETLTALFKKHGVFDGSENYPTMNDLYTVLQYFKNSKHIGYRYQDIFENLISRVRPYVLMGESFNVRKGMPVSTFTERNVVLELPTNFGTDMVTNFLICLIIIMAYNKNIVEGNRGNKLRTLFIVDEASTLMQAGRDKSDAYVYESSLNEITRKAREFGIGLWLCSQEAKSFNYVFQANSMIKVGFPLDGVDHESICKTFGLNEDQEKYLYKLPFRRVAVARTRKFDKPFLIEVPWLG